MHPHPQHNLTWSIVFLCWLFVQRLHQERLMVVDSLLPVLQWVAVFLPPVLRLLASSLRQLEAEECRPWCRLVSLLEGLLQLLAAHKCCNNSKQSCYNDRPNIIKKEMLLCLTFLGGPLCVYSIYSLIFSQGALHNIDERSIVTHGLAVAS